MNQRFYLLSEEKQMCILNAGYKVFSESSYKKAPTSEIAEEAGISKALLFHYFRNKKELYFYLWNRAIEVTRLQLEKDDVLGTSDIFEMLKRSLHGKCEVMRKYPYMGEFTMKAYFEHEPDIKEMIQSDFDKLNRLSEDLIVKNIDKSKLPENIDIRMMYREMVWAADGYMHMADIRGKIDPDKIEKDFEKLITFWIKIYGRSEKND